ncbi:MAG: hypothetical protein ACREFU_10410 [Acetobacteraceae bacterium]
MADQQLQPSARSRLDPASNLRDGCGFIGNDDFQAGGGSHATQHSPFIPEGHASRNTSPCIWPSADVCYNVGGKTSIDRVPKDNAANTMRPGAGKSATLWRGADVTLNVEPVAGDQTSGTPGASGSLSSSSGRRFRA